MRSSLPGLFCNLFILKSKQNKHTSKCERSGLKKKLKKNQGYIEKGKKMNT